MASEVFPGFSSVYLLSEPGGSRVFRGEISLSVDDAFAVTRAEKEPGRVEVRWVMGGKLPSDVIRCTVAAPFILHERVVSVLRDGGCSGWGTYACDVIDKTGAVVKGYSGLAVRGRCGPIDNALSVKFDKIMPGGAFKWWRGLYFDPATWDGSDVFVPEGNSAWILVVERVKKALDRAKVKNIEFTSLDTVERMML